MSEAAFFKAMRDDGCIFAGIDVDHAERWRFFEGRASYDHSSILWYVDVKLESPRLVEGDKIRELFRAHGETARRLLRRQARSLLEFSERAFLPFSLQEVEVGNEMTMKVSGSAMWMQKSADIARELEKLADEWDETLDKLEPVAEPAVK